MEETARRFARRILLLHVLLLAVVVTLVSLAAHGVYDRTRAEVIAEASQRQALLASQTARGISSYYESIISDLDLLRRTEGEEPNASNASNAAAASIFGFFPGAFRDRLTAQPGGGGPGGAQGQPRNGGNNAAQASFAPVLWKQLSGRASHLFAFDKRTSTVRDIGGDSDGVDVNAIAAGLSPWLHAVTEPSVSSYIQSFDTIGGANHASSGNHANYGGNVVCVPNVLGQGARRLLVAIVPAAPIQSKFITPLASDPDTRAWLVDDKLTAIAGTSANLTGVSMTLLPFVSGSDVSVTGGTRQTSSSLDFNGLTFEPSLVSYEPVTLSGDRHWQVYISTPMTQVDAVVTRLFGQALKWAIFVVISVTAVLTSTAIQLIRSRTRIERERHELLTRELSQARKIQLAWLPTQDPGLQPGWSTIVDVAAINSPASHISGDFYNWFDLNDGRIVIVIGDVTGHGMSAAFLMATTQLLVRNTMARLGDPAACLGEVNRQLCVQVFHGQFVTMQLIVIDPTSGTMDVATAGHPPPLVSDGESFQVLPLEPHLVLGVDASTVYEAERFALAPGASVLLYTDGVIECANSAGHRFETTGLRRTLGGRFESARIVVDRVSQAVNAFRGPKELDDDLTVVAVQLQQVDALNATPLFAGQE